MSGYQVASLYASFSLEGASFVTPLRNIVAETEKASRKMQQEQDRLAKAADRLLSAVDPAHAAQSRYNKAVAEAERLYKAGAISADQLAKVEQHHKLALDAVTNALDRHNAASAQSQQRMRQLGYQVSDIGAQLVGGQSPFMILAQQGPQVAMAFDGAKGAAGRFASFMTGPWGAAILAATSAVGMLWMKLAEGKEASEKNATATKTLRQAIEDLDRATGIYNQTLGKRIGLEEQDARQKYNEAAAARAKVQKELEAARKRLAASSGSIIDPAASASAAKDALVIQMLEKEISKLSEEMADAERSFRRAEVARAIQQIREELDPTAAAIGRFDRAVEALAEKRANNLVTQEQFDREYKALEIKKEAELEAAKATEKSAKAQSKAASEWEKASNSRIATLLRERTVLEQYAKDQKILQEALAGGSINADEFDLAGRRAREAMLDGLDLEKIPAEITKAIDSKAIKASLPKVDLNELVSLSSIAPVIEGTRRLGEEMRRAEQMAASMASTMSSSFEEALFSGKSLRSVFTGLIEDMGRMVIRFTVLEPLARNFAQALSGSGGLFGGGGGVANGIVQGEHSWFEKAIGGFGSVFGGLFGGFRAAGGPVSAGKAYVVGERGPELFAPASAGTIIPNGALAGMSGGGRTINITVNAQDAVLASTVKGWVQEAVVLGAAGGSTMAQHDMARRARRRLS